MSKVRLQVEMSEQRVKEVNDLMIKCGVSSKKEFFNNALTLLGWVIEEVERGNEITSLDKERKVHSVLRAPMLSSVKVNK